MHVGADVPAPAEGAEKMAWYRGLTGRQWFVLIVCWLGWLFDTMDQQLFIMARSPAMADLIKNPKPGEIPFYGGLATMFLVFGWATGGIVFGILGDRWGRAKTLVTTVLCYSVFTGLSALSVGWLDFSAYRFLTGLGVGGTFAAAVSMVAETLPPRSRPYALGFLQVLAALGNVTANAISMVFKPSFHLFGMAGWRVLFLVGIVPAVLVLFVVRKLQEPESWIRAREARARDPQAAPKMGSLKELFGDPRWRRNLIVGVVLGLAGVIGLWGIGFWMPELVREVVPDKREADTYASIAMMLFNGSAAVGTYLFAILVGRIGRRPAFAMIFTLALVSVFVVFGFMNRPGHVWWMAPLLGLGTLTIFGGYSIYFPELFPTRLRATGVGFCYNTARYLAAPGAFALGWLSRLLMADPNTPRGAQKLADFTLLSSLGGVDSSFRYGAIIVSVVFLFGLVAILFAPETKGKPLPE